MTKYIIRKSLIEWESGTGWTSEPIIYNQTDVTKKIKNKNGIMECNIALDDFSWVLKRIDFEIYRFDTKNDNFCVNELIKIEHDKIETVEEHCGMFEKKIVWNALPPHMTYNPRKKYYFPYAKYIDAVFGSAFPRCLDRKTVDRLARDRARDTGETIKSYWDMFYKADSDEIKRFAVYNSDK